MNSTERHPFVIGARARRRWRHKNLAESDNATPGTKGWMGDISSSIPTWRQHFPPKQQLLFLQCFPKSGHVAFVSFRHRELRDWIQQKSSSCLSLRVACVGVEQPAPFLAPFKFLKTKIFSSAELVQARSYRFPTGGFTSIPSPGKILVWVAMEQHLCQLP